MGLLLVLLVGAICGWLASMVVGGGGGLITNIVIGVVGALIAGLLFGGGASILNAPLNATSILFSVLGSIILLAVVNMVRGRRYVR